ncbi:hypothetical protein GWK08_04165 [Leptobacterium flavescens]|uniref:Uncharacterized protein n=1 Tax=Leptobacterium flavescens TaxID=472055 RepID=A0A6P0UNQ5_9FLAO|nr:ankyrin repeat domain-containing protein [Leptobacterium flavescens]NER12623.1 hypothetical protein [Leptobacterium flavescens]
MIRFRSLMGLLFLLISLSINAQTVQRAVCEGNLTQLDSLLTSTDIHIKDKIGRSLAHYAIACRQEKVMDFLIERGMDVNMTDDKGYTPLFVAVQFGNDKMIDKLIGANVDINKGVSSLHRAVLRDNLKLLKRLVNEKTDVDVLNDRGNTPLTIAMRQGSDEIAAFLISRGADKSKIPTYELKGDFLGQTRPGLKPEIFAPNVVSTEDFTHSATFTPDGKEFYYTVESRKYNRGTIMVSRREGDQWSIPEPADIEGEYREIDPFVTADGSTLLYSSNRPAKEGDSILRNIDLWMVKRKGKKWGTPIHLGAEVNTAHAEWFPTVSKKGTLFFSTGPDRSSNIYYSEFKNGKYQKAIPLGDSVNSEHRDYDPLIAPDESYVIFSSRRPGGMGGSDLYISFKNEDGSWTKAKNMGSEINTTGGEFAPGLSHDGKYFFFTRRGDIYWVDAKIIQNLRIKI